MRKRNVFLLAASALALGCVDAATDPTYQGVVGNTFLVTCPDPDPSIFRPECMQEWNATDQTAALNAAFSRARQYKHANGGMASHVYLRPGVYTFTADLNASTIATNTPGIIVRNENHRQGETSLVTDVNGASVVIQSGDVFQYLVIQGPHRNEDPADFPRANLCSVAPEGRGEGVNGSRGVGWTLFASTIEGFAGIGLHMSGTVGATVSHTTIQQNGLNGVQIVASANPPYPAHTIIPATGNTIRNSVIWYNGANGIDLNADSTRVYQNDIMYNGRGFEGCETTHPGSHDTNGVLIWGVPAGASPAIASAIPSNYNVVDENVVFENARNGIWVGATGASSSEVEGNVITRNLVQYNGQNGIKLDAQLGANVATRVVSNTSQFNGDSAIVVLERDGGQLSGAQIINNALLGSQCGNYWGGSRATQVA